jgi:glycosyltransferase involved in cell wall biosynthesis
MKLVIDGVFFGSAQTGCARIWASILPRLARYPDLDVVLLDRGDCPSVDGIEKVEFPPYARRGNTAADSLLVDKLCTELGADVFCSTYYTTPATIPSVLMVYDMAPEALGFGLRWRVDKEKQVAISFASYYACVSESVRSDLERFYPSVGNDRAFVTQCGVERKIFAPRGAAEVESFKTTFGITKPYYLLIGSREEHAGYKNASLAFEAVARMRALEFELLCVGGEAEIQDDALRGLPANVSACRMDLTDDELARAYSGAEALVYPTFYDGCGMPVVEAMACGCPVISTKGGALGEVAGEAALFVTGRDPDELRRKMEQVREPGQRQTLINEGLKQASRYGWDAMARGLHYLLTKAVEERKNQVTQAFFQEWERLRAIQAEVETAWQTWQV